MSARRLSLIVWEQAAKQIEEANDWWREHREAAQTPLPKTSRAPLTCSLASPASGCQLVAIACLT